ncbi:MAG TPA: sugar ABC transporter substrate-binding protein [Aliiroseovarius sp.]|nr:sugar ABC transporter substrate-binding protein [Aliiroseovarius sp.]
MKKVITALAVSSAAMGAASTLQAQEVHMIMCGGEIREADQKVIADFEASRDGVTVNAEAVPWGTCQDKSMTLAAAGDAPALAYMGSRTLAQLAENGLILPVEIADEDRGNYQPGILATVTRGGKTWGFPHAFSTKALYMNCDVIEAAGQECVAPATWDDMYNLAKAVKDALGDQGVAGVGLAAKDFDNTMHQFLNYLYSNGGKVLDTTTGEALLDSPQTRETLEFYGKLAEVSQEGPTAWERDSLKDLFNDGKIAMYINGPWGRGQHNEDINQLVAPVPAGPSGESGTILITDSIAVFANTGVEDLAMDLAKALSSGEAQYDLDKSWGLTPILQYTKLGNPDPYYSGQGDDEFWANFVNGIGAGGPEPSVTDFKALQAVFVNMIQGIVLQDDTVDNLVTIAGEELAAIE